MFLSSAIAEAAATSAPQTGFLPGNLKITDLIFLALALYFFVQGIMSFVSHKPVGYGKDMVKYTDESLKAFAPAFGIGQILVGIGLCCYNLPIEALRKVLFKISSYEVMLRAVILVIAAVVGVIILIVGSKKLVLKDKQ